MASHARSGLDNRVDILGSVFSPKTFTIPTPEVTPNIGALASPGRPLEHFENYFSPEDDAARLNRAWSQATRFLSLTNPARQRPKRAGDTAHTSALEAISFIISAASTRRELHAWYLHEIEQHFRASYLPTLSLWQLLISEPDTPAALVKLVRTLHTAQSQYFDCLSGHTFSVSIQDDLLAAFVQQVRSAYHRVLLNILPRTRILKTLAFYLFSRMEHSISNKWSTPPCVTAPQCMCAVDLDHDMLVRLQGVGLGGELGEQALAFAMHRFLEDTAVNRFCFRVDWTSGNTVIDKVRGWVKETLTPTMKKALHALSVPEVQDDVQSQLMHLTINSFGRSRVANLLDYVKAWPASRGAVGDIREYLSANGPAEKASLCASFTSQLRKRILHTGVSTSEILGVYMSMISVFNTLDPRKVLFEKVATAVRLYLRNREDTVKIVAASFLFNPDTSHDETTKVDYSKVCVELAIEVDSLDVRPQATTSLNFDDMAWMPEPIDAASELKSNRSDDLIASILALFGADDFAQAFHTTLGQHLLEVKSMELIKETKLIEILKDRLDSAKLQAFEVMMKDIRDSSILNKRARPQVTNQPVTAQEFAAAIPIHGIAFDELWDTFRHRLDRTEFMSLLPYSTRRYNDLYYPKRSRQRAKTQSDNTSVTTAISHEIDARITSRHYWPHRRAHADSTNVPSIPPQLQSALAAHEQKFTALSGGQRRIDWDHAAGRMRVALELEDRELEFVDVETHRVIVIDAFATDRQAAIADQIASVDDAGSGWSVADLVTALGLAEDKVVDAVNYWLAAKVLYVSSPGRYAVLERLDMISDDTMNVEDDVDGEVVEDQLGGPGTELQSMSTHEALLREQAQLYSAFILNMLRNTGPKQVDGMMGITALLKMMMLDFPYGDEEVRWLLVEMAGRGEVKKDGEMWSAV